MMAYEELTHKIIGCAMKVHGELKSGFQEKIYHRAMEIELEKAGLSFSSEQEMDIFYSGVPIGKRYVDLFIENAVMVELKAVSQLEDVHLA
jgi:GxxExxY protein